MFSDNFLFKPIRAKKGAQIPVRYLGDKFMFVYFGAKNLA
jgi:hypothetical protein